jgi:hypothetical protein
MSKGGNFLYFAFGFPFCGHPGGAPVEIAFPVRLFAWKN